MAGSFLAGEGAATEVTGRQDVGLHTAAPADLDKIRTCKAAGVDNFTNQAFRPDGENPVDHQHFSNGFVGKGAMRFKFNYVPFDEAQRVVDMRNGVPQAGRKRHGRRSSSDKRKKMGKLMYT